MVDMMEKVSALRELINKEGYDIEIEVDGGINAETAAVSAAAGANVLVAGSSVFAAPDAEKAIADIREAAQKAYK
jgi:ribulose-phosphate 3-epimerase